ncbi:hypothetical protein EJ02DRAFT_488202, partial [Clathrospora elynae]
KKEKEEAQLQKQIKLEERRVERERLKKARQKEKADKAVEQARQKQERDSAKALQLSQKGKRPASQAASSSHKRQKHIGGQPGRAQIQEEPSAPLLKVTSCGCNINLPNKFR